MIVEMDITFNHKYFLPFKNFNASNKKYEDVRGKERAVILQFCRI